MKYLTTNVLDWLPCCSSFPVFFSTVQLPQQSLKTSPWSVFWKKKKKTHRSKNVTTQKHLDHGSLHVVLARLFGCSAWKNLFIQETPHYLLCPVFANIILSWKTRRVCKWILENVDHFKRFSELKHQCRTEPCNTSRAISLFGGEKGVVISMSPVQEQQSLPSNAVLCNINQDLWAVMELQQPSEKGGLLTDEGTAAQTTPLTHRNTQTHSRQPACKSW